MIRTERGAKKVPLEYNQTIEVEECLAEPLVNSYKDLVFVEKKTLKAKKANSATKKKALKKNVETQDVKAKDVSKA